MVTIGRNTTVGDLEMETCGPVLEMSFSSQHASNEPPGSFSLNGKKLMVEEVIDQWHEAKYEYLILLADDEQTYFFLLRQGEGNYWELQGVYA